MPDKIKIKNCPFNHQKQNVTVIKLGEMFSVHCTVCGTTGPVSPDIDGAISKWGSRETVVIPDSIYEKMLEEINDGEETDK